MSKTKIVMFNPLGSPTMAYDGPPLSILMAASLLDTARYDIKIIDWHYPDHLERIAAECRDALVFGATCLSGYQIKGMLESVEIARHVNPGIKIVCGGWHASFMPEQILQSPFIDYAVIGQGQLTFKRLVECLESGAAPDGLTGLAFRVDGGVQANPPGPVESLADLPPVPYHLLERPEDFLTASKFGQKGAYIFTSQGCPGQCGFCSEAAFHKRKWTYLPTETVRAQIREFKSKYGIDSVIIPDSNFFVSERRTREFCRMISEEGVKWGALSGRPDTMARFSEETWQAMKAAKLDGFFIGTESVNDRTLALMNKQCTVADTVKVIEMAHKYGLNIQIPFIIGVPGADIEEDFRINMEFVMKYRDVVDQFHMFMYTPFPGTGLLPKAIALGYRVPERLEGWIDYGLHAEGILPWVPKKWPGITDQLAVYFQFLCGNPVKIIKSAVPGPLQAPALALERVMRGLCDFRVRHSFFRFPLEYKAMKLVVKHRRKIFRKSKLVI